MFSSSPSIPRRLFEEEDEAKDNGERQNITNYGFYPFSALKRPL